MVKIKVEYSIKFSLKISFKVCIYYINQLTVLPVHCCTQRILNRVGTKI